MITKRHLNAGLNGENGYADTEAFVGFTTTVHPAPSKVTVRWTSIAILWLAVSGCASPVTTEGAKTLQRACLADAPTLSQGPVLRMTDQPCQVPKCPAIMSDDASNVYIFYNDIGPEPRRSGLFVGVVRADGMVSKERRPYPQIVPRCVGGSGDTAEFLFVKSSEGPTAFILETRTPRTEPGREPTMEFVASGESKVSASHLQLWGAEHFNIVRAQALPGPSGQYILLGTYGEVHWLLWGFPAQVRDSFRRFFTIRVTSSRIGPLQPMTARGLYRLWGYGDEPCPKIVASGNGDVACALVKGPAYGQHRSVYVLSLWAAGQWHSFEFDPTRSFHLPPDFTPANPALIFQDDEVLLFDSRFCFEAVLSQDADPQTHRLKWNAATEILKEGHILDAQALGHATLVFYSNEDGTGFVARTRSGWTVQSRVRLECAPWVRWFRACVSPDGRYHIVWPGEDGHLYYTDLRSAAVWVEPQKGT